MLGKRGKPWSLLFILLFCFIPAGCGSIQTAKQYPKSPIDNDPIQVLDFTPSASE
jgi:hypothetical protein